MQRAWLIVPLFGAASLCLYIITRAAPPLRPDQDQPDGMAVLSFPTNLAELRSLANLLHSYQKKHSVYVSLLFISAYLYKQAFGIPGSVFLNILGGAIYGAWIGFPLVCLLTACGASLCYILSRMCLRGLVARKFPHQMSLFRRTIETNKERLLYYLLSLRLMPLTPGWFLNIASPMVNVPLHLFFISIFFGAMPYNYLCVSTGVVLSTVRSLDDVFTWKNLLQMALMAGGALTPAILKRKKKSLAEEA